MRPPGFARALLLVAAGQEQAEFVAGDLEEEFAHICEARGQSAGNRWYRWQVVRSLAPLVEVRIRSGEMTAVVLRAFLGVALPLLLLDRLWSFIYSQIPLKDGLHRAPQYLAVNLTLTCVCAAMNGGPARGFPQAAGTALGAAAAAAVALWVSAGAAPPGYVAAVLLAAPASSLAACLWRKSE